MSIVLPPNLLVFCHYWKQLKYLPENNFFFPPDTFLIQDFQIG